MKAPQHSILVVVCRRGVLRADFHEGGFDWKNAARQNGTSVTEGFAAALALGGQSHGAVWLLSDEWFSQTIQLNPAQVAGLSHAQLRRALSFEAEPFSGIPMSGAALDFRKTGEGGFDVLEIPAETRDRLFEKALERGCQLKGIAFSEAPPEEGAALRRWLADWMERLESGQVPCVGAPVTPPSPKRFQAASVWMAIAAAVLVCAAKWWLSSELASLRQKNAEFSNAANDLATVNRSIQEVTHEIDTLRTELESVNAVATRRLSIPALLHGIAVQHKDEVVIRKIETDGPSSSILHGVSLTSDAVDELGIVLKESLRGAGWSVFPRKKSGLKKLPNGGPWEFSLTVIHQEAAHAGVNLGTTNDN